MAISVAGAVSGVGAEVGGTTFRGLHVHVKPLEYGSLGHYRTSVRIVLAAAQAANSRLLELRNTHASNLLIPTRLIVRAMQIAAGTAQENSLDCYRLTGFTAVDTTNTVTPTSSVKRTSMAAYPGTSAAIRHCTLAGAAAGMTGGTLTKDAQFFATLPLLVNAAAPTTPNAYWGPLDALDDVNGTHPFVLAQNEGIDVENRVLNVTSYGMAAFIDLSWADVAAF